MPLRSNDQGARHIHIQTIGEVETPISWVNTVVQLGARTSEALL